MKISTQYYIFSLPRSRRRLKFSSSNEGKLGMMLKKTSGAIKPQTCHWCITAGTLVYCPEWKQLYIPCWPRMKPLLNNQHFQVWLKFASDDMSSQMPSRKEFYDQMRQRLKYLSIETRYMFEEVRVRLLNFLPEKSYQVTLKLQWDRHTSISPSSERYVWYCWALWEIMRIMWARHVAFWKLYFSL